MEDICAFFLCSYLHKNKYLKIIEEDAFLGVHSGPTLLWVGGKGGEGFKSDCSLGLHHPQDYQQKTRVEAGGVICLQHNIDDKICYYGDDFIT